MANQQQLDLIRQGALAWNEWRKNNSTEEIDLSCLELRDVDHSKAILKGANLQDANFRESELRGANLYVADLRRADFRGANLQGATFRGANLRGANLRGANLNRVSFVAANLEGANLTEANLQGATFSEANLRRANLQGATFSEANLRRANLQGANLNRVNLKGAYFSWADLEGANLEGANLDGANFKGGDLYRAKLTGAIVDEASLPGTYVYGTKMIPDQSSGGSIARATPDKPAPSRRDIARAYSECHDILAESTSDTYPVQPQSPPVEPQPSPILRYPYLECPFQIALHQKFSLFVKLLNLAPNKGSIEILIDETDGIPEVEAVLRVNEDEFRFVNSNMQLMQIAANEDSEVKFILTPVQIGEHHLRVDFYQYGRRIGSIQRVLIVLEKLSDSDGQLLSTTMNTEEIGLKALSSVPPPDLELYVQLDHHGRQTLYFTLHSSKEEVDYHHTKVGLTALQGSPLEKMQAVYQQMNHLTGIAPTTPEEQTLVERRIASLGNNLWDELIPESLKQEYWKFKSQIRSLLITSDEPWVPWEMVKPYRYNPNGEREDQPFWCQQFALSRWMSGPGTVDELTVKTVRPIAPEQVNLPAVYEEIQFIERLADLRPDIVPLSTFHSSLQVLDWLEDHEASILHFACHGMFDANLPNNSAIKLSDGFLCPSDIRTRFCGDRQRPIVFINACHGARMEFSFTGLGGWAERFIQSRVGSFIGAMWEVNDTAALEFTKSFYTALLKDSLPIAEAFRFAREQIRQSAPYSSTWLAYVLYADPEGRIKPR
jgi:uncharacterized protein YjbI with pentapeptide repeats